MSAAAVMDIYLVRHGETDWNRAQRLQGTIETPLNLIGIAQAGYLADRFRLLAVSSVVTSPLGRARSTARAIARGSHAGFVVDPLLAEIDHGSWAGLTIPTIARTCPGAVTNSQLQPEALDVSGGETLAAAYHRASAVLRRLVAASPAAAVVVVSHGVINALLICAAAGKLPTHMREYTQPNGSTYRLRFRRRALVTVECIPLVAPMPDAAKRRSFPWRVIS
jgi:2,3-bisphosphoglycerate-dependent phosphoglycerate mutase